MNQNILEKPSDFFSDVILLVQFRILAFYRKNKTPKLFSNTNWTNFWNIDYCVLQSRTILLLLLYAPSVFEKVNILCCFCPLNEKIPIGLCTKTKSLSLNLAVQSHTSPYLIVDWWVFFNTVKRNPYLWHSTLRIRYL